MTPYSDKGSLGILEFSPNGIGSVFVSGLSNPEDIAIQMENIPEPSSLRLTALATVPLIALLRRKRT